MFDASLTFRACDAYLLAGGSSLRAELSFHGVCLATAAPAGNGGSASNALVLDGASQFMKAMVVAPLREEKVNRRF